MKKTQYLTLVCLLAGTMAAFAQAPAKSAKAAPAAAKGDVAKGKAYFDGVGSCALCHDAATTEKKMGPGLKGLYKRPKLATNGKPTNDANVAEKIATGGNGMPPVEVPPAEKANLLAYLKSL